MYTSARESYLYSEGFKATSEMYKLLESGYFSKPGWSLGVNAEDFRVPRANDFYNENRGTYSVLPSVEIKDKNVGYKGRNQFQSLSSGVNKGFSNRHYDDWSDVGNASNTGSRGRHLSQVSSNSGSELKYTSFVEDVLSQSSERGSVCNLEGATDINNTSYVRKFEDIPSRRPSQFAGHKSTISTTSYKGRVTFDMADTRTSTGVGSGVNTYNQTSSNVIDNIRKAHSVRLDGGRNPSSSHLESVRNSCSSRLDSGRKTSSSRLETGRNPSSIKLETGRNLSPNRFVSGRNSSPNGLESDRNVSSGMWDGVRNPDSWNDLQRQVYCNYMDFENHRWKWENEVAESSRGI